MKTIGLLGGMSWESSAHYYQVMNEAVQQHLGGLHSAKILMNSVDFAPFRKQMLAGDWEGIGERLARAAQVLEQGGADLLVIGTNTMHMVAPVVAAAVDIPLLHIADATAEVARSKGARVLGLLGTRFTMEERFYIDRLAEHGMEAIVPPERDRSIVDAVIFDELCKGRFTSESRQEFLRIIDGLASNGADAVVLGCTEIGLLVNQGDTSVTLLDTCAVHAQQAVEHALSS